MKTTILIITICALTIRCNDSAKQNPMLGLFKKKDKIDTFWTWFVENKKSFEQIDSTNRDEKLNLILAKVHNIEGGLSIEISKETEGIRELTISPEGDRGKFQIVKDIVNKVPKIPGWTVVAFRQPLNFDFSLEYEDITFRPSEMFFHPLINDDSLDLIIYAKNISRHDENKVTLYGLITMDNLLGEYDCVIKVRHYDFQDLDEEKDKSKLKPLTELKAFVADFHKARNN